MAQPDGLVEFGGQRTRPDLVGDVVEIEMLVDRLGEQSRWWAEHGPKAACGCPARFDGTDPYLHRDGCTAGPQPLCPCVGVQHDPGCRSR